MSGQLTPYDAGTGDLTYKVAGELVGTWVFPTKETQNIYVSERRIFQKGTEYFDGCVNLDGDADCDPSEPKGRFRSEYISWTYLKGDERLADGGCTHLMNGGKGAFKGVRGLLRMIDVYAAAGGSVSNYQGEIILNAEPKEKEIEFPTTSTGRSATASAVSKVGC